MLARHNTEVAFDSMLSILSSTIWHEALNLEAHFISMRLLKTPELEPRVKELIFSEIRAIRLAASMMIRNYPNEENIALVTEAIQIYGPQDDYEKKVLEFTLDTLTRSLAMEKYQQRLDKK